MDDLESLSICTRGSVNGECNENHSQHLEGKFCELILYMNAKSTPFFYIKNVILQLIEHLNRSRG